MSQSSCEMADLLLCEKEQKPEPLGKVEESNHRDKDDENSDLLFVGMEHVNEDDEVLFVRVISKSEPVISHILNRVVPDSRPTRNKGCLVQDTACTLQPTNHLTPMSKAGAIRPISHSGKRALESPIFKPSSKCDYKTNSTQVVPGNSSDLLSPGAQCLLGAVLSTGGKDESPHDSKRLSTLDINSRNPNFDDV